MKKFLSFFVVFVLVSCLSASFAYADAGQITVSSASAERGDAVSFDVVFESNPGVMAIGLDPVFDSSVLEFVNFTSDDAKWYLEGTVANFDDGNNNTFTGKAFTMHFNVKSDAPFGESAVSVAITSASDYDENDVAYNITAGKVTVTHTTHTWDLVQFNWNAEGTACETATFKCTVGGETQDSPATVTSSTVAATCETDGSTTYTATTTFNGTTYTDTKSVTISKLGHSWGAPSYVWTQDGDNWVCTATIKCANDVSEDHIVTEVGSVTQAPIADVECGEYSTVKYVATFTNSLFQAESTDKVKEVQGAKVDHEWGTPTYVWADDFSTCTASHVCNKNSAHTEEIVASVANGKITSAETTAATCEAPGVTTYTATFTEAGFTTQTATDPTKPVALGHAYGEPVWTWAEDFSSATATFTCTHDASHVQTPDVTVTPVTTPPTCTEQGKTVYTAKVTFNGTEYTDTKEGNIVAATGHSYGTASYEWSADKSTCTASHTCTVDNVVETETVNSTSEVTTPATCETAGETTYTATFTKAGFETKTDTAALPAAFGHDYGTPTYEWNADYSSCTATRVCSHDASHVETETVDSTNAVATPATCTTGSITTYTATFTNTAFAQQVEDVTNNDALGHTWGEPAYTWAADYSTVTATRTCARDTSHVETETVAATKTGSTATCDVAGVDTYTSAAFTNAAFTVQTKDVNVDALGHDWGEPSYEWADDGSTCTGTRVCKTDGSHTETANGTVTSEAIDATCEKAGGTKFTATFTAEGFTTQTKELPDATKPATGHSWGDATATWASDFSSVTLTRTCKNDATHVDTATSSTVTSTVTKAAAVGVPGETTYSADVVFSDGTKISVTTVDKTKPVALVEVKLVEGDKGTAYYGSTYTFRSNAELKDFIALYIDAKVVDRTNYELKEGSTIVTLKDAFIKTLKAGTHTVSIVSTTGSAVGTFSVSTSPKTADTNFDVARLALIVVLAGFGAFGVYTVSRKRKSH